MLKNNEGWMRIAEDLILELILSSSYMEWLMFRSDRKKADDNNDEKNMILKQTNELPIGNGMNFKKNLPDCYPGRQSGTDAENFKPLTYLYPKSAEVHNFLLVT